MSEFLDCNKEPIKNGYIVYVNIKKEDGTIEHLALGEVIRMYRDPSLLLCVGIDDENCCIIPPEYVSVAMPSEISEKDDKMLNHPELFPAYPLKKY